MMRRVVAILCLLVALPCLSQQRDLKDYAGHKQVNFGVKGGFNSSMMLINQLRIDGQNISDIQNEYEIGYFASLFMRINFDRHFLQPELSYNINQCEVHFSAPRIEGDLAYTPQQYVISSRISCIELPVLYGYNFVKEGPYQMAIFGGPNIRYIWNRHTHNTFHHFSQTDIEEEIYPFNLSLTLGLAVTISRIFVDFRYDIGLHNISKNVSYTPSELSDEAGQVPDDDQIHFHRRYNTLSFSLGVYF